MKNLNDKQLAKMLDRNWNKTQKQYGTDFPALIALIKEFHSATIATWADSPRGSEHNAYRKFSRFDAGETEA